MSGVGTLGAVLILSGCGNHAKYSVSVTGSAHPRLRPSQVASIVENGPPFPTAGKVDDIVSMTAKRRGLLRQVVWIVHVRGKFHVRDRASVSSFSSADLIVNDWTGIVSGIDHTPDG